ncbi:hypothetical protein ColTof4_00723 [Colletotrichum tofieldiae]|nr:hypothetical protein ColTof3_07935 [Colletotrichum tofieldiae]GKT68299.1 hypothetical protein ColTof4_00723 [Colletotrichum tofieldiae]
MKWYSILLPSCRPRTDLPDDRRSAVEHPDLELLVLLLDVPPGPAVVSTAASTAAGVARILLAPVALLPPLLLPVQAPLDGAGVHVLPLARPEPPHVLVVPVQDGVKVGPAKVRGVQQPRQGALRVLVGAVHLEQPAVDVGDDVAALLGDVRGDADVEVLVGALVRAVPVLAARHRVEQVGDPEEVVAVADGPVEVDAAVVGREGEGLRRVGRLLGVVGVRGRRRLRVLALRAAVVRLLLRRDGRLRVVAVLVLVLVGVVVRRAAVLLVVAGLQVREDAREGGHADAGPHDDGVAEVVEALGRRAKGAVDAHVDLGGPRLPSQPAQPLRPVAVRLDVQLELPALADRNGKGVPLKGAEPRHLQEDVLAGLVLPDALARDGGGDLDRLAVEHLEGRLDLVEARADADGALDEDEQRREGEEVAEHGPLQQVRRAVGHHEADDGVHEQVAELEDLVVPVPHLGQAQQREDVEGTQRGDARGAGQGADVADVRPRHHVRAEDFSDAVLVLGPAAVVEGARQVADGVQRGEGQRGDGDLDVEGLAEVPVDEARDVVGAAHPGGEVARHAEQEEEEGHVQHAGGRLGHDDAPAEGGAVLRLGHVLDALPDAEGEGAADDEAQEGDLGPVDGPVGAQAAGQAEPADVVPLRVLRVLVLLQGGDLPPADAGGEVVARDAVGAAPLVGGRVRGGARVGAGEAHDGAEELMAEAVLVARVLLGRKVAGLLLFPDDVVRLGLVLRGELVVGGVELGFDLVVVDVAVVVVVEVVEERVDLVFGQILDSLFGVRDGVVNGSHEGSWLVCPRGFLTLGGLLTGDGTSVCGTMILPGRGEGERETAVHGVFVRSIWATG